jgi:peptidyl-prolyl cis-trans isomerase A (cyclophilin A)
LSERGFFANWRLIGLSRCPSVARQPRGYVASANTGRRTRPINLRDNSAANDSEPAFARFGKVVEGWDVVGKLYGGYGENSGSGMRAGHQDKLFEGGNAYMDK